MMRLGLLALAARALLWGGAAMASEDVIHVEVPTEGTTRWIGPVVAPGVVSGGLVVLRGTQDAVEVSWYDDELNALDARWAAVPRGSRLVGTSGDAESLFALLVGPGGSQITLLEAPWIPAELGSVSTRLPRRVSPVALAVGEQGWWLLSRGPRGPLVHRGTLDGSSELKAVSLPDLPRRARAASRLVEIDGGFDLSVFGHGKRAGLMQLYHLDANGAALVARDEGAQGADPWTEVYRLPGTDVVAGTWGFAGFERVSAGLRWAGLRDGEVVDVQDVAFSEVPGALVHLSERRRARLEGGKRIPRDVASAVTRMHEPAPHGEGLLAVVEHFQPRTRLESRTESFMVQGRMVQRVVTREVFLGWEPTHALAWSWSDEGEVKASFGIALEDLLVPAVRPQLAISAPQVGAWLAWADDQRVYFRAAPGVSDSGEPVAVSLVSGDVLGIRTAQVAPWGAGVLVWGQQRSTDGVGKRYVPFLARVPWPSPEAEVP